MDAPQRLWGPQTELAVGNFPIARRPLDVRIAKALARIKRHAAAVNAAEAVPGVTDAVASAIADAARRVEAGELDEHFPIDVFQTGSGTSTNMNVNEVLSTLASATVADGVHPNDHVNASQSSNDVFPSAVQLAALRAVASDLVPGHPTLGDVDSPQALADYQATKRAHKAEWAKTRPPKQPTR